MAMWVASWEGERGAPAIVSDLDLPASQLWLRPPAITFFNPSPSKLTTYKSKIRMSWRWRKRCGLGGRADYLVYVGAGNNYNRATLSPSQPTLLLTSLLYHSEYSTGVSTQGRGVDSERAARWWRLFRDYKHDYLASLPVGPGNGFRLV